MENTEQWILNFYVSTTDHDSLFLHVSIYITSIDNSKITTSTPYFDGLWSKLYKYRKKILEYIFYTRVNLHFYEKMRKDASFNTIVEPETARLIAFTWKGKYTKRNLPCKKDCLNPNKWFSWVQSQNPMMENIISTLELLMIASKVKGENWCQKE